MATYYNPILIFNLSNPSVIGMSFPTANEAPTRIDFAPGTSSGTQNTVTSAAASWDWAPLPIPNPTGFVAAITADNTLSNILYLLMPYYAAILSYATAPAAIKGVWAQLKTVYSAQLTSGIVSTIEGYATANNMPLT